jgi:integrase
MSVRKVKVHGRKVWQARVAYQGLRKSVVRGSKEEARTAESELLQELKKRLAEAASVESQPATVRRLLELYVSDLQHRGEPEDSVTRATSTALAIEKSLPALLDRPITSLNETDFFAFRNARLRAGRVVVEVVDGIKRERRLPTKPSTINRDLRTLRAALKRALPAFRFPASLFFREDETRVRWLRPEEELLLLETMSSPCREIAKLASLTLMRLSEIRMLRREMVHLEQGVILLPQAKAGARPVVLSGAAQKLLAHKLQEHQREWVFPNPNGAPYSRYYVSHVFRKAARLAGLKDFHFHDLRHHGATMALNKGFTAPIVMALGGWKTERMMRRYAAVTDTTLRAAAEAVSGNEPWQPLAKSAPART